MRLHFSAALQLPVCPYNILIKLVLLYAVSDPHTKSKPPLQAAGYQACSATEQNVPFRRTGISFKTLNPRGIRRQVNFESVLIWHMTYDRAGTSS